MYITTCLLFKSDAKGHYTEDDFLDEFIIRGIVNMENIEDLYEFDFWDEFIVPKIIEEGSVVLEMTVLTYIEAVDYDSMSEDKLDEFFEQICDKFEDLVEEELLLVMEDFSILLAQDGVTSASISRIDPDEEIIEDKIE